MNSWVKILLTVIPKKALAEAILGFLKDFAKHTKTEWDNEFIENLDKWLRLSRLLDAKQINDITKELKDV